MICGGDNPTGQIGRQLVRQLLDRDTEVATRDIASTAANLLTDLTWTGQENLPVFGPDRLTPDGMAEVISQELGRPVAYTTG
jgi:uncharacterized protein YbjT (DUF2867 family)